MSFAKWINHSSYKMCFQILIKTCENVAIAPHCARDLALACCSPTPCVWATAALRKVLTKFDSGRLMSSSPTYASGLVLPVAFLAPHGGQLKDNQKPLRF